MNRTPDNELPTVFSKRKQLVKIKTKELSNDIPVIISLDYDGCGDIMFNSIYTYLKAFESYSDSFNIQDNENFDGHIGEPFNTDIKIQKARELFMGLINNIKQKYNILFVGSARQTNFYDNEMRSGAMYNHGVGVYNKSFKYNENDGFCFKDFQAFTEMNTTDVSKWEFNNKECNRCLLYQDNHIQLKTIFIQDQLEYIVSHYPTATEYHFIDDRVDILEGLQENLTNKTLKVPDNITVHLHKYDWYLIIINSSTDELLIQENYFVYKN